MVGEPELAGDEEYDDGEEWDGGEEYGGGDEYDGGGVYDGGELYRSRCKRSCCSRSACSRRICSFRAISADVHEDELEVEELEEDEECAVAGAVEMRVNVVRTTGLTGGQNAMYDRDFSRRRLRIAVLNFLPLSAFVSGPEERDPALSDTVSHSLAGNIIRCSPRARESSASGEGGSVIENGASRAE